MSDLSILKYIAIFLGIQLIIFFVTECNNKNETANVIDLDNIKLTKDLCISTKNVKKITIGNFRGLAVDSKGKIYTADTKLQKIHIFSSNGHYQGSLGEKGKGPGKFFHLDANIQIRADTLYISQPISQQVDLFNLKSNHHIRTITLPVRPRKLLPQKNGNFLVTYGTFYIHAPKKNDPLHYLTVAKLNSSGNYINKKLLKFIMLFPSNKEVFYIDSGSMSVYHTSIFPDIEFAISPQGYLYVGNSDSLKINKYSNYGKFMNKLTWDHTPASFSKSDLDSLAYKKGSIFKKAIQQMGIPKYWPAFQYFIIDDEGHCWVKLLNPGNPQQTWLVFGKEGDPKWKFKLPTEIDLFSVRKGEAYGIYTSPQKLSSIYRYKINIQ